LPHSNFHPELGISPDGSAIGLGGPITPEPDDGDLVSVVISAFVTQEPAQRAQGEVQQGATGAGSVELQHADFALAETTWEKSADTQGGGFHEGWAFASAEMIEKASDGAIERYTWSQWVWLSRRP
jgi:hypothetical protein